MMNVPAMAAPSTAGVVLVSGRRLNEILRALQARTQLNAAEAGPRGMRGTTTQGGPGIPRIDEQRFDPAKVYFLSRGFLDKLEAALAARTPLSAGSSNAGGFTAGDGIKVPGAVALDATPAGLAALLDGLRRITPRQYVESGPRGYRLEPGEARPLVPKRRGLVLETQQWWAEAYYCYLHAEGGVTGVMHTTRVTTTHYQFGSITTTDTAAGGPFYWLPGTSHGTCPPVDSDDDRDPEKEYGTVVSGEAPHYSGGYTRLALRSNALGAVARDPGNTAVLTVTINSLTNISGSWFELDDRDGETGVRVWFNRGGFQPPPPAPPGGRTLQVLILATDTTAQVATRVRAALNSDGAWTATGSGISVTVTWTQPGARRGYAGSAPVAITHSNTGGTGADFNAWTWLADAVPTFPASFNLGVWISSGIGDARVFRPRYRWRNTGKGTLRIAWNTSSGGSQVIFLDAGARSAWQTSNVPTTINVPEQITGLTVARV